MTMLKNAIKKYLPKPDSVKSLAPFRRLGVRFAEPALWTINHSTISRGTAVGLFCAFLPLPLQMFPALALSMWWRANLPVSMVLVWISNPLTWLFMYAPPYFLGATLLGEEPLSFAEISLESITQHLAALWLGCLIFGVVLAMAGYFAVRIAWQMITVARREEKKQERKARRFGK